jgi:rhodanese-related sulfurtransferase
MSDSPVIDEITPDELYQDIRRGSRPLILDVRNEEEFASWAIEGLPPNSLLNIPYFVFLEDEAECLDRVPRGRDVTVVCAKGGSSAFVASILTQHGIRARNLQGGMIAWGDLHVTTRVASPPESTLTLFQINRAREGERPVTENPSTPRDFLSNASHVKRRVNPPRPRGKAKYSLARWLYAMANSFAVSLSASKPP